MDQTHHDDKQAKDNQQDCGQVHHQDAPQDVMRDQLRTYQQSYASRMHQHGDPPNASRGSPPWNILNPFQICFCSIFVLPFSFFGVRTLIECCITVALIPIRMYIDLVL